MNLSQLILANESSILNHASMTQNRWSQLINLLNDYEKSTPSNIYNENIWTFLIVCGYAIAGTNGVAELSKQLTCNSNIMVTEDMRIWLEPLPYPPRNKEGNSHIDLAIGTIEKRMINKQSSDSGIQLSSVNESWICFSEMKWYSDISLKVSNDLNRNQLIRIIDNAICFQNASSNNPVYAKEVYVTLVTPEILYKSGSRLYSYKFNEYEYNKNNIVDDLNNSCLTERNEAYWKYPADIIDRMTSLNLNWVTYETLFNNLPSSSLKNDISEFFVSNK